MNPHFEGVRICRSLNNQQETSMRASILAALFAASIIVPLSAQESGADSDLDALLKTPISTAAKYEQPLTNVAASVTVITAEETARYGWHTLADVLNAMRGLHTTHDRRYTVLGVRGVSLQADYNNRFLVLIDGHPLTENVLGSVGIDTALALDLSQFSRIELVRGPGSVLYGTAAMFGVINLITKDEREHSSATLGAGSHGLWTGAVRAGFGEGELRGSIAASWQEEAGGDLYYPEFDRPELNDGVVRGRDFDDYDSVVATLRWRDVRILALHSSRTKGVPTTTWGSTFGGDEQIAAGRRTLAIDYTRRLRPAHHVKLSVLYDRYRYEGTYPAGSVDYVDQVRSTRLGAEVLYLWDIRPNHRLSAGAELVRNSASHYRWAIAGRTGGIGAPYTTQAFFAQVESHLTPRLSVTVGGSLHLHERFDAQITPRAAAIYHASPASTFKILYGHAFRNPNTWERDYDNGAFLANGALKAEGITTYEAVWEQRLRRDFLATLSLFHLDLTNIIRLQPVAEGIQHQNVGHIHTSGVEFQLDHRTNDGIWSYAGISRSRATEEGKAMTNSPDYLLKAGMSTPTARRLYAGAELQYQSRRLTLTRQRTEEVLLANLNVGFALTRHLQVTTTVRNVFDADYATPGGPEHLQDTLAQDGRTVLVRIRLGTH